MIPWYQLHRAGNDHPELVVGGVVEWREYEERGRGGDYWPVDPFTGDVMVKSLLRGGALWIQRVGWQLNKAIDPSRRGRVLPRRESVRGVVAEYGNRLRELPEYCQSWSDDDWLRYANYAHDRRSHGDELSALDHAAIARTPGLLADDCPRSTARTV